MTLLSQKICRINASLWSWFFFLNQPHQEHVSILLVGSVNVKLASWAHSWWYEMTLTCLRLFVMRSFTVVIQTFLLCFSFFLSFTGACPSGTAGMWGCLLARRSGSSSPKTGSRCPVEGQWCCDSTGSLWSPAAHARMQRWPAGYTAGFKKARLMFTLSNLI